MPEDESMQDSINHRFEDALMTLRGQIDREAAANRAAGEAGEALDTAHREKVGGTLSRPWPGIYADRTPFTVMTHLPITDEMLEDAAYLSFTGPIPDEVWARPTRLMRLHWQIRVARSRAHDAWLVLAGKAQIKDDSDYDDWED